VTVVESLAQRRRILFTMLTALTFRYPPGHEPPLIAALHQWLHGWPGIGPVVAGMARHQYDLQFTRYGHEEWRATFYPAGIGHSLTPMVGSAWDARALGGGAGGGVGRATGSRRGGGVTADRRGRP
jgi:hypothetical protein